MNFKTVSYTLVANVTTTNYTDVPLVGRTTYYYVVTAQNYLAGESARSAQVSATAIINVPPPWMTQDIGAVGLMGTASYTKSVFTVTGSGADIQDTADAFRFVYVTNSGDFIMVARVVSLQNGDGWAKAGLMIRDSLDAGAANAFMAVTPGNGVTWQARSSDGGGTSYNQTGGLSAPYWLKLVRTGNTFTGYRSPDGTTWTQQGSATLNNFATAYVGLAVTAHNNSFLCTATFDNVSAPGWPPSALMANAVAASTSKINLNWNALTNAVSYSVKRSLTNGGIYSVVASGLTATNYADGGLASGTTYYYVVNASLGGAGSTNSPQVSATTVAQGSLQSVANWGPFVPITGAGPISMYVYVPTNVVANPPILVQMHNCGGTAPGVFGWAGYAAQAEQYGFIIVVPEASDTSGNPGRCWDNGSTNSLTRFGGGDTQAIVDMVNYTVTNFGANSNRVYLVGLSSGAMMTEALCAVYPDVFKAGAEFSGVPAGADGWGGDQMALTPQQWGDQVRAMDPGYSGYRPRMQLWHGTADTLVSFNNQLEAINEWSNVLGVGTNANYTETTTISGITNQWMHQVWWDGCGNTILEAWSETGGGHNTDAAWDPQYVIPFLCLDQVGPVDPATICGAPKGLVATAVSSTQVSLTWNALTNATSYNVKRSLTNGGSYATIATGVTATNYSDSGLSGGTIYYYVVSAIVSGSETPNSAQASAWTQSGSYGSLIHRYSFSETNGAAVADSVGGPVWAGTLPSGGTLAGGQLGLSSVSQQYASLPAGIVGSLSNFTVMVWVNLNSLSDWSRIFDFGNNTTTNLFLTPQCGGSGTLRFAITTGGGGSEQQINSSATLSLGAWHQVAVTLSGGTGVLYLDGTAVGTNSGMTINPSSMGSTVNNYLGKSQYPDPYLNGSLDEFRIYNVRLSSSEIAAAYALGTGQQLSTNSPAMNLALTGTSLTLSWPLANAGFTLQSRTNLFLGNWVNVTSLAPQIISSQWQVALPLSPNEPSVFYRLSK